MIIYDDEGQSKVDTYNGLTLRHPQAALTRSSTLLPDYDLSEAQHQKVVAPTSFRRHIGPKIWKAVSIALGIYLILSLVIVVPIVVTKKATRRSTGWPISPINSFWVGGNPNPPAPLQTVVSGALAANTNLTCNAWETSTSSSNIATANYQLPPTGVVTVRSNITSENANPDQINGNLTVSTNKNTKESNILFVVKLQASDPSILHATLVCFSESGPNRGVSLYIPEDLDDQSLYFDIQVILPQGQSYLDTFVAYLPMFSQSYGNLQHSVQISKFTVEGAFCPIICQHSEASEITVINQLSSIEGVFKVTNALKLDTIKGPVNANITLVQLVSSIQPTYLTINTGESSIEANVLLETPSNPPFQGFPAFVAGVNTFNGSLQLNISYDSPLSTSVVQLQAQTNQQESTVFLDSTFQGTFLAQSKLSQVIVKDAVNSSQNDPTGAMRMRTLLFDQERQSMVGGWMGWGTRPIECSPASQSYVEIVSALSPVNLFFGHGKGYG